MPFTTPEQFIALAALLLGGWLLGYASAPSPRKWKRRARTQAERFTTYHTEAEDRLRAANQRAADLNAEAEALRCDHAEAERTIAVLRSAAPTPVVAEPTLPEPPQPEPADMDVAPDPERAAVPMTPVPTEAAPAPIGPAEPEMPRKGWFTGIATDKLTRISGIDAALDARLADLGVVRFDDIEKLSAEDEMALELRLKLPVGYITREQWRVQAAMLAAGQDEEHAAHFAPAPIP